jgi:hypothetical protein
MMSRLQLIVDPGAANHALQGLETFGWKWIAGPDGSGSAIDVGFCYVGTASLSTGFTSHERSLI